MSLVGPVSSVVLAAVTVIFYIVSTATNNWVMSESDSGTETYYGLWESCNRSGGARTCEYLHGSDVPGHVRAARGLMLTAVIFAGISWILVLVALIGKVTEQTDNAFLKCLTTRFWIINGLIFGATVLLVLIGTSVYAAETNKEYCKSGTDHSFGYSIIIGWISIPLGIIAATMLTYFFRAMGDDD
ncbi:epithelial membrane protein 1-like [Ptychodera flava]|uniref:epithelial membrane protein 1-like n=1 Tax=Ptychodera flava TaxID=63121 RepID=UPI003969D014